MKQKISIIIIFFLLETSALLQWWHQCSHFQRHYSGLDLQLRLIADIHNDPSIPIWQTRFFHNKILGTIIDAFNTYLKYWDLTFLMKFISPAGAIGIFSGLFYWVSTKKKTLGLWLLLCYLLFIPLFEVFDLLKVIPFMQILILAVPYIFWSLFGYYRYSKNLTKIKYILLIVLILLSLWYFAASTQPLLKFCD